MVLKGGPLAVVKEAAANAWLWVKAIPLAGDLNPRNNLPGAPALTPWLVVPFVAGLIYCLRRAGRPEYALLPLWFAVMLLPSILSEYAPSFQRAVGAVPPLALMVGVGLWWLGDAVARQSRRPAVGVALVAVLVIGSSAQGLQPVLHRVGSLAGPLLRLRRGHLRDRRVHARARRRR